MKSDRELREARAELSAARASLMKQLDGVELNEDGDWYTLQDRIKSVLMATSQLRHLCRVVNYGRYLQTDAWRQKAEAAKASVGYRCQVCNQEGPLDAHHRTYERLGCELPEDITVLCRSCHELFSKRLQP